MQQYLDVTNPNIDQNNSYDVGETEGLQITLNGDPRRDNLNLNEFNISSDKATPHILLNSMSIMHESALDDNKPKSFKVECKLWTNGLDRFFKVCRQLFNNY